VLSPVQLERFMAKVHPEPNSGCWLWMGGAKATGYGRFSLPDSTTPIAHRIAYEHFVGPIARGLTLDHLCRVRSCVNPRHLEAVTLQENQHRGFGIPGLNARKMSCPQGHRYDVTILAKKGRRRGCRTCTRAYYRRYRQLSKLRIGP
jgi:hypothetical protein